MPENGREHASFKGLVKLMDAEPPAFLNFFGIGEKFRMAYCGIDKGKLFFGGGFPYISLKPHGIESGKAKFLGGFTVKGIFGRFSKAYMAAYRGVPVAGIKVFTGRPFLKVNI